MILSENQKKYLIYPISQVHLTGKFAPSSSLYFSGQFGGYKFPSFFLQIVSKQFLVEKLPSKRNRNVSSAVDRLLRRGVVVDVARLLCAHQHRVHGQQGASLQAGRAH